MSYSSNSNETLLSTSIASTSSAQSSNIELIIKKLGIFIILKDHDYFNIFFKWLNGLLTESKVTS